MKGVLYLDVEPHLYEFICAEYQSIDGEVEIKPHDKFFWDIKYILELNPKDRSYQRPPNTKRLTLLLPYFTISSNPQKNISPLYRNYLPPKQQYLVRKHFLRLFKRLAHTHIFACALSGKTQAYGIRSFIDKYNIAENEINYEMIKKSWDRSAEKYRLYKKLEKI